MGMAVTDKVPLFTPGRFTQALAIVAVEKGDFSPVDFDRSKSVEALMIIVGDGLSNIVLLIVNVTEDKMGLHAGEEIDDRSRTDIATMNHVFDAKAFEHADCVTSRGDFAMCVANNPEQHGSYFDQK